MIKFGTVGVVNTAVDLAIYNALLVIGPVKANLVAMTVATVFSYLMNRHWTYSDRQRGDARREFMVFFALNLAGCLIQTAPVALAKYGFHFSEKSPQAIDYIAFNVAKLTGIGVGMLFRFWAYRTFVFKNAAKAATANRDTANRDTANRDTAAADRLPAVAPAQNPGGPDSANPSRGEPLAMEFAALVERSGPESSPVAPR